jgi:hypothetical protein
MRIIGDTGRTANTYRIERPVPRLIPGFAQALVRSKLPAIDLANAALSQISRLRRYG